MNKVRCIKCNDDPDFLYKEAIPEGPICHPCFKDHASYDKDVELHSNFKPIVCYVCGSEDTVFDFGDMLYPDAKRCCKDHLPEEDPRPIAPAESRFNKPFKLRENGPDDACVYCHKKIKSEIDRLLNFVSASIKNIVHKYKDEVGNVFEFSASTMPANSDFPVVPMKELTYWRCKEPCGAPIIDPRDPKEEKKIASLIKKSDKLWAKKNKIEIEYDGVNSTIQKYYKEQSEKEMKQYIEYWANNESR